MVIADVFNKISHTTPTYYHVNKVLISVCLEGLKQISLPETSLNVCVVVMEFDFLQPRTPKGYITAFV